jgi:hypothetical protein
MVWLGESQRPAWLVCAFDARMQLDRDLDQPHGQQNEARSSTALGLQSGGSAFAVVRTQIFRQKW